MRFSVLILLLLRSLESFSQKSADTAFYGRVFRHRECDRNAFDLAIRGYNILLEDDLLRSTRYLTIIDFTRPSNQPRLFVLDVLEQRLVLASITAHGLGSDPDSLTIPYRFGNRDNSRMSSVGFYVTGSTYANHRPDDSLGLCLFGLDKGYNDAAAAREIVIHYGATEYSGRVYVTDSGAARSFGCPALPLSTNSRVINLIKGGSCLFIYSDKEKLYPGKSSVLNGGIREVIRQQGPPPNYCSCELQPRRRRH